MREAFGAEKMLSETFEIFAPEKKKPSQ